MFSSFRIRNFRCFDDFNLQSLGRINLIVGRNNVGKTTVLEALYIHVGANNPQLTIRISGFRGIDSIPLHTSEAWAWLFHNMNFELPIEILSDGVDGKLRTQKITVSEQSAEKLNPDGASGQASSNDAEITTRLRPRDLILQYTDSAGVMETAKGVMGGEQIRWIRSDFRPAEPGIYLAARSHHLTQGPDRFSQLALSQRDEYVMQAMRAVEPGLKTITILSSGKESMLYGDVGIGLIPIQNMGGGMVRLLEIALALASVPNGVLLIDEIENGLHHSVLSKVWRLIGTTARELNIQVFATTHSWHGIQSAHEVFSELGEPDDLKVHRLERRGDKIAVTSYGRDKLGTALEADLEVR